MLIADRQRSHCVVRMVLQYAHLQNAALLLLRQPRMHHAAAPHLFQIPERFNAPIFQHQHLISQMQDLIQRVADVKHRNINFARQTLQVGQ